MANNPVQENANAEDHGLTQMQQKLVRSRHTLNPSSCCIFRVPRNLANINGRCYQPQLVSIGPYHHGELRCRMVEDHKWRLLDGLLKRTDSKSLTLEDYWRAVQPRKTEARDCYSDAISLTDDQFIEMLVLDGCFVIELFRIFGGVVAVKADDPLLSLSWVYSFFLRDLIRLENQIPLFVLDCLFNLTQMPGEEGPGRTLSNLTLKFFNRALRRSDEFIDKFEHLKGQHLLDSLRMIFFPELLNLHRAISIPEEFEERIRRDYMKPHEIQCISKLRRAGIKLKAGSDDNFLVVEFRHGVIKMPTIRVDDFMSAFLRNCVAYEQCHSYCPRFMTAYAKLLDCLINTAKDVEYLCDKKIIENYFGTDYEIARFINNMGKDVEFDVHTYLCYLSDLFYEVKDYYNNNCNVQWASFKNTYFNTPWSFISAVAAFALLILTATQTYYTVLSYSRQR